MNWKKSTLLAGLGIASALVVSLFQSSPGYTDADYYFATGLRIANGEGLTEPFVWNYLGDFPRVTHPSHAYWMPMASFISALSMMVFHNTCFGVAKLGFLIIAGIIPFVTARIAYKLSHREKTATFAGLIACFPGFYTPYLPITETFGPYMLFGGLFFLSLELENGIIRATLLGGIAAALHLTRTEGLLWLGVAFLFLLLKGSKQIRIYAGVLLGYALVFGPWVARNALVFDQPLGPGGFRTLWLTEYNDLFVYPSNMLSFQTWWSRGIGSILRDRYWAFKLNLQTFAAVQSSIFLLPLIFWGGWQKRHKVRVQIGAITLITVFLVMTFVFPFQGARGGYFHTGAGVQPFLWALAAVGFSNFVEWGISNRSWDEDQAWRVIGAGVIALAVLISGMVTWNRVIGDEFRFPIWNESYRQYQMVEKALNRLGIDQNDVVMLNNPPGYYAATQESAIAIPDGGVATLLAVAKKYGADFVVLDQNYPQGLSDLYAHPGDKAELNYLITENGKHYFKIEIVNAE